MFDNKIHQLLKQILENQVASERKIEHIEEEILGLKLLVLKILDPATSGEIQQNGADMITGVVVGSKGVFSFTPNGALQKGTPPVWSTGDTSVTLIPAADGLTCEADVAATETLTGFGLSVHATASDGTTFDTPAQVPVLPKVVPATAGVIDQVS